MCKYENDNMPIVLSCETKLCCVAYACSLAILAIPGKRKTRCLAVRDGEPERSQAIDILRQEPVRDFDSIYDEGERTKTEGK